MALWWCAKVFCRLSAVWFPLLFSALLWQTVNLHRTSSHFPLNEKKNKNIFGSNAASSSCRSSLSVRFHPARGAVAVQVLRKSTARSDTLPPYQKPSLETQRGSIWGKIDSLYINTYGILTEAPLSMPA